MQRWIGGRIVTGASARDVALRADRLVGLHVASVEARGKHLLIAFGPGPSGAVAAPPAAPAPAGAGRSSATLVLHTHLGMKGAWLVRPADQPWRRSLAGARVVIEAGDHHAACVGAPLVELRDGRSLVRTDGDRRLERLGPDAMTSPLDADGLEGVVRRARVATRSRPGLTVGELLLDQSVLSGIGNVYRCEALFAEGISPFHPAETVEDDVVRRLFVRASTLLRSNLEPPRGIGPTAFGPTAFGRDTGLGRGRAWVHGRAGRPCRRCGTRVRSELLGRPGGTPRIVYWCSRCQPAPRPPVVGIPGIPGVPPVSADGPPGTVAP